MTYTKHIVGIDPGGTTGIVVLSWEMGKPQDFEIHFSRSVIWDSRGDIMEILQTFAPTAEAVIIESFSLYAPKAQKLIGNDFPSVRIIGWVEATLHALGCSEKLHMQQPSVRANVEILSRHVSTMPPSPHIRDAYQHARYWLVTEVISRMKRRTV